MTTAQDNSSLNEVYKFCDVLTNRFNIGFIEKPMYGGVRFIGEYYTRRGQIMTLTIDVTRIKVSIKIYDTMRRLVFNRDFTPQGLVRTTTVFEFIARSMQV